MEVTLAVTHSIRDMESEEATSCSQTETPVDRQTHQPPHKTFNPKFILATGNVGTGDGAETEGMANQ